MTTEKGPQYLPLKDEDELSDIPLQDEKYHYWRRRFYILLGLSMTAFVSMVVVFLNLAFHQAGSSLSTDFDVPYSPAAGHVGYINRYLTRDPDTHKFMGNPRPELDEAWHNLLEATLIRVSEEELLKADNASSVAHVDGGYVAGLGISHSLHCLKRLKQYLHPQYYYSHEEQDWDELFFHADHCLEGLRQVVMCQADLSVYTLEWTPHSKVKPTVRVPQPHACVNWPQLHDWMKGRAARADDMVPPPPELFEKEGESAKPNRF